MTRRKQEHDRKVCGQFRQSVGNRRVTGFQVHRSESITRVKNHFFWR
ncbi:hypothetical protein AC21_5270 [Escherichia coli 2-474-04_S3_C2]|nr:hypothetical protein ECDEC7C_5276 [Escherichia coli DEC7C]ENE37206.1 hypothetical protein ECP03022938_4864 [Escherichia coli P0302293.8]KDY84519.1 hypothetical protein AC21_5270 [Escherichia coli 2-474-04_S3_C2]